MVMAWLAGKLMGRDERQGQPRQAPQQNDGGMGGGFGGGGLGDILGQILGGGSGQSQQAPQQTRVEQPQFRQPESGQGANDAPQMRIPIPSRSAPRRSRIGLGGGLLGQILAAFGGGRR